MAGSYTPRRAQRTQAKLRMALAGPPNAGKTFTALLLAKTLARPPQGERCFILVIDTERGSSQKYAGEPDIPEFDVIELERFSPDEYLAAIRVAATGGYDVLIVDSLSHAWTGIGGVLDIVDQATMRSKSQNPFTEGWRTASPLHAKLVDGMLQSSAHVICTMRTKTEYLIQEVNGRKQPKEVGTEPVQRAGIAYEFDIVGDMDKENTLVITKTRCRALNGGIFPKPGEELATIIAAWLSEGAPTQAPEPQPAKPKPPAGASSRPVNTSDRQGEQAKQDLILNIVAALKRKYPGDDRTAKQDRADLAREYFGTDVFADFKSLPLAILQEGYTRLERPSLGARPTEPTAAELEAMEADVPVHAPPDEMALVDGEPTDPRSGEVFRDVESVVTGVAPMDDETATESLLAQLTRYADSQGMVPAWQGLLQDYDAYRLEDGVLILTAEERETLLAQAAGLWPGVEDVVKLV